MGTADTDSNGEDEQKEGGDRIQKLTDSSIAEVGKLAEAKEKEIMEI